jgi:hypothetical protein
MGDEGMFSYGCERASVENIPAGRTGMILATSWPEWGMREYIHSFCNEFSVYWIPDMMDEGNARIPTWQPRSSPTPTA